MKKGLGKAGMVMNLLTYKGYYGSIETEDDMFFGEVLGLNDTFIPYEGSSMAEAKQDFRNEIDDYLKTCQDNHEKPELPDKSAVELAWRKKQMISLAFFE